jgi:hypothetical protein
MLNRMRRSGRLLAVLAVPFLAAACSDDDDNDNITDPGEIGTAQVRVVHLSPDAPAVDVAVNGEVAVEGAAYLDATGYLTVPAGEIRITVTPAGQTQPVVIDATVTLGANASYTVAATGFLADIQPLLMLDDRSTGGDAKIRFVHTSPDAPPVTVAVTDGPNVFGGVEFRDVTGYAEVPGGSYDLEVRVAGTSTVALALPGTDLAGGTNYTVFATGLVSDGSLGALPVVDAP